MALCIAAGVGLGLAMPGLFCAVAAIEVAHVNLAVATFIWVMIYPMMTQVDWSAVKDVGRRRGVLALTLVVNWLIKPFTMAALGVHARDTPRRSPRDRRPRHPERVARALHVAEMRPAEMRGHEQGMPLATALQQSPPG